MLLPNWRGSRENGSRDGFLMVNPKPWHYAGAFSCPSTFFYLEFCTCINHRLPQVAHAQEQGANHPLIQRRIGQSEQLIHNGMCLKLMVVTPGFVLCLIHFQSQIKRRLTIDCCICIIQKSKQSLKGKIVKKKVTSPSAKLHRLGGWCGGSIGQMEALAGINIQSHSERVALWAKFRHLFAGPSQELVDAVMDHCAKITLRKIKRGELSLIQIRY